jgi:hypothetical protein
VRTKSNLVPPDEVARTVVEEVTRAAKGLRGRRRREFVKWAMEWWRERLAKLAADQ